MQYTWVGPHWPSFASCTSVNNAPFFSINCAEKCTFFHVFRVVRSVSKLVLYCHVPLVVGFGEEGKNSIVLNFFLDLFCGPCTHCNITRLFRVTNFCSGSTPLSLPSTIVAFTPSPPLPLSLALNHLWLRDMYLLWLWIDPDDNFLTQAIEWNFEPNH